MEKDFGKSQAILVGWEAMKRNVGFFVVLILALLAARYGLGRLVEFLFPDPLEDLARFVVDTTAGMVFVWAVLRTHDGRPADLGRLVDWNRYGNYLAAQFLYLLIIAGGLLLLVIPGIVWAVQFQFAGLAVLDEGLGPVEALRRSSRLTRGGRVNLLLFDLLVGAVNLLGFAALLVGLFATLPATGVGMVSAFRFLQEKTAVLEPIQVPPRS